MELTTLQRVIIAIPLFVAWLEFSMHVVGGIVGVIGYLALTTAWFYVTWPAYVWIFNTVISIVRWLPVVQILNWLLN